MRTAADSPSDRPDACPLARATWTSVVCWQGARCPRGGPAPPRRGHSEAKPVAPPWGSAAAKPSALTGEGAALRRERAPARRPPCVTRRGSRLRHPRVPSAGLRGGATGVHAPRASGLAGGQGRGTFVRDRRTLESSARVGVGVGVEGGLWDPHGQRTRHGPGALKTANIRSSRFWRAGVRGWGSAKAGSRGAARQSLAPSMPRECSRGEGGQVPASHGPGGTPRGTGGPQGAGRGPSGRPAGGRHGLVCPGGPHSQWRVSLTWLRACMMQINK